MTLFRAPARHQKGDHDRDLTGTAWAKGDSPAPRTTRSSAHQTTGKAQASERLIINALMDCYNG